MAVAKKGIAEMHALRHMDFNSELHAMFVGIVTESSSGSDKSSSESFDPEKYKTAIKHIIAVIGDFAMTPAFK